MFEGVSTAVLLLYVIVLLVTLILLTLLVLLVHSGLFRPIEDVGTGKPPIGQIIIAYKFQRGPYNEAGQIFTEAATIASQNKAVGIYYDDPNKVEPGQLRYAVGSILCEGSAPVDEEMVKRFTEKDYKILHLPEVNYVVKTSFPHITTLSILIAVYKAYPRLKDYIEERKLCAYPFMEYYDGKTIHFLAPLSKQDEFYVPECEKEGAGDMAATDWDSTTLNTTQSSMEESRLSQDVTQSTVGEDSVKDSQETVQQEATPSDTPVNTGDGENADTNGNNNAPDPDGEAITNDDEQVSDDSSSSFEVLKTEHVE